MSGPLAAIRSVRGRITLISTALVAVTLVAASLWLLQLVQADLLAEVQDTLDQAVEAQAEELEAVLEEAESDFDQSFDLIEAEVDGSTVEIGLFRADEDGYAFGDLYVNGVLAAGLLLDPESGEVIEILDAGFQRELSDPDLRDDIESLVFDVFELADQDGEGRFVVGAAPLDEIEASVDAIRDALTVIVPTLVALFGLLTWWLVGRALRPVVSITDQVQAISSSSLDRRVPVPATGDEIANLATVMNRMLDRLQRGGERQRQFSADASHELRSPLSTVRAAAEMLQRNPDPNRTGRLADDIVAESDRMEQLIADLLELSRLDPIGNGHARRAGATEEVDLVELLTTEVNGDRVEIVAPPRLDMNGSPQQLRRLIRNLVDNAHRHAADRVIVGLSAQDGTISLTVDDDGPGVPEASREMIFERFARLDDDRSREVGGAGLGLALVRSIAEHHNGAVAVDRSPLGGARFTITLNP